MALLALSPHLSRLVLDHLNGLDTGDLRCVLKMYSIVQRGQSEIQLTGFTLFRTIGQHCQALKDLRLSHCTVAR